MLSLEHRPPSSQTSQSHSPISNLPTEIVEEVVASADWRDYPALCLLSRLFHSLSVAYLYRDVALSSNRSIFSFCVALNANPLLSSMVKTAAMYRPDPFASGSLEKMEPSDYPAVIGAFQKLPYLESLTLDIADEVYKRALEDAEFPFLNHLRCRLTLDESLIAFLNRHPSIVQLQLERENVFTPIPSDLPPLKLPNLRSFIGDAVYVPHVAQESSLGGAMAAWNGLEDHTTDILNALGRSSGDSLMLLSCRRRGWNLDLLEEISNQFPDILCLDMMNVLILDTFPSAEALEIIRNIMGRFNRLRKFTFKSMTVGVKQTLTNEQLDRDFRTVMSWGKECPTLRIISLSYSPDWFRVVDDLWVPDENVAFAMTWFRDMLKSDRFTDIRECYKTWSETIATQMMDNGVLAVPDCPITAPVRAFLDYNRDPDIGPDLGIENAQVIEVIDAETEAPMLLVNGSYHIVEDEVVLHRELHTY